MKDYTKFIDISFGKQLKDVTRMSDILQDICKPIIRTQSTLDSAFKSQIDYASKIAASMQPFHTAFEPASFAFAKINENGISRFLDNINRTNDLIRMNLVNNISDVIGRVQLQPQITLDKTFLSQIAFLNDNLADQFKNIVAKDLISTLRYAPEFKVPSAWDRKTINEIYEEIKLETDEPSAENNVFSFLVLAIVAVSGIDISDFKNPQKRNIVWAQIFHVFLILAISQSKDIGSSLSYDVCVATRGCVIRMGPSYNSKRISALPKNYTFKILEDNGDWYKVQFVDVALGFKEGWIKKSVTSNYPMFTSPAP